MEEWGCSSVGGKLAKCGGSAGSTPDPNKGGLVVYTSSVCTWEVEARGAEAQGQPWLNMELEVMVGGGIYWKKKTTLWSLEEMKPLYGI